MFPVSPAGHESVICWQCVTVHMQLQHIRMPYIAKLMTDNYLELYSFIRYCKLTIINHCILLDASLIYVCIEVIYASAAHV